MLLVAEYGDVGAWGVVVGPLGVAAEGLEKEELLGVMGLEDLGLRGRETEVVVKVVWEEGEWTR